MPHWPTDQNFSILIFRFESVATWCRAEFRSTVVSFYYLVDWTKLCRWINIYLEQVSFIFIQWGIIPYYHYFISILFIVFLWGVTYEIVSFNVSAIILIELVRCKKKKVMNPQWTNFYNEALNSATNKSNQSKFITLYLDNKCVLFFSS